jgi:xanthine dehydrogenase YagT iron-sulfur-binding subunit
MTKSLSLRGFSDNVPAPIKKIQLTLKVNGTEKTHQIDPRTTLLGLLRDHLDLTGTKNGCDIGQCGSCTVLSNGRRIYSCMSLAAMHEGDEITTIEGLSNAGDLHPLQLAFIEQDGLQCGYCTPGQIMAGAALLNEHCGKSDEDVREAMNGNLCRCGAYANIVAAIQQVRKG